MALIAGHGAYVPLYRIDRETIADQYNQSLPDGEVAVPGRDENLITMGCEAAGTAIDRSHIDGSELDAVFVASISDKFAEHGVAPHVAYRLGAEGDIRTGDFRATARAAGDAIAVAKHFLDSEGGNVLIVGVDAMPVERGSDDEPYLGSGAGALILSADDVWNPSACIIDIGQHTNGFVESHRRHEESRTPGDPRFERTVGIPETTIPAVREAASALETPPSRYTLQAFDHRARLDTSNFAADAIKVSTFPDIGYAGAATFYLDTIRLLEQAKGGTSAVAVSYGAGGADAVALEMLSNDYDNDEELTLEEYINAKEYVSYAEHLRMRESFEQTEAPV